MRVLLIYILLVAATVSWSQHSLLIGYWKLQQVQINDQLVFESNDSTVLLKSLYANESDQKAVLTKSDSLRVEERSAMLFPVMAMTFIEFQKNNHLRYGIMEEYPEGVIHKIYDGSYEIDGDKYRITLFIKNGAIPTVDGHFTVTDNTLIIYQTGWENSYNRYVRASR